MVMLFLKLLLNKTVLNENASFDSSKIQLRGAFLFIYLFYLSNVCEIQSGMGGII